MEIPVPAQRALLVLQRLKGRYDSVPEAFVWIDELWANSVDTQSAFEEWLPCLMGARNVPMLLSSCVARRAGSRFSSDRPFLIPFRQSGSQATLLIGAQVAHLRAAINPRGRDTATKRSQAMISERVGSQKPSQRAYHLSADLADAESCPDRNQRIPVTEIPDPAISGSANARSKMPWPNTYPRSSDQCL
jgi:hypothetical protein